MTRQSPPSKQLLEMIGPTLSPLSLTPHSLNNGTDKTVLSVTRLKIMIISTEMVLFHFNNLNRFQADFYSCLSKVALTTH